MKALVQDFLNGTYHPFSTSVPSPPSLQQEQAPSSSEDGQTHSPHGKSGQAITSLRESGQTPHRRSSTNSCKPPPKKKRKMNGEFTHIIVFMYKQILKYKATHCRTCMLCVQMFEYMYCTCIPMCTCIYMHK